MRLFALALACASVSLPTVAAEEPREEPVETPILVPSPIPVGVLIAWKPMILSVRADTGQGSQFGSDKLQPLRILGRYTTTLFHEKLLARAELEGGQFQTDTQGKNIGTEGYDVTARLLGGTATRISPLLTITASAGLITRYQRGRAIGGAPSVGVFGGTSNVEFEFRVAPAVTASFYVEGGLVPIPYGTEAGLGVLSDASELRSRVQLSFDLTATTAIDVGYDFTRWHASFAGASAFSADGQNNHALLLEDREHALTIGFRWKP